MMLLPLFVTIACSSALIDATFVTQPVSLNTSLNSHMNFTCEATDVLAILFYVDGTPALNNPIVKRGFSELGQENINGTMKRRQLLVHARERNNNTIIYCVNSLHTVSSNIATLTIQGLLGRVVDLDYTFINGSSVLLTWRAPYTLDNVPITGYYIANGSVNITTTNNNIRLSATNPDPCILNNVSVSPINDVGIGSSNNISFYYETVPLITPAVSVVPVVDGRQIFMRISINVSELCIGEYPSSVTVIILNINNEIQDINSISTQVNQLMITGVITVPNNLNAFIVNVSMSNNGGDFLTTPSFGFGFIIESSIDNCSTIDITWTGPGVDDRVSTLYYDLSIYDEISGACSLVDTVSVYNTSYQFVDDNLFLHRYIYAITGVNELGGGISINGTFSYQRVPRSVAKSGLSKTFNETMASVSFNIPVTLECTGEAPENATVTIQCNGTGVIYDNVTLVKKAKQPMNITGSVPVPLNQQCNISIVFSNEVGSSKPFVLAFDTAPTSSPTGTVTSTFIAVLFVTIAGGTGIAILIIIVVLVVVTVARRKLLGKRLTAKNNDTLDKSLTSLVELFQTPRKASLENINT